MLTVNASWNNVQTLQISWKSQLLPKYVYNIMHVGSKYYSN